MAELKTKPTEMSVETYLNTLEDQKKNDAKILIQLMQDKTYEKPVMWGTSIVGFGNKKYKYESGREIDYFLIGFSARKKAITLYLSIQINSNDFSTLGKHEKGVGCLYIKKLEDINIKVLAEIIQESVEASKKLS
jgi:hypothetical protein